MVIVLLMEYAVKYRKLGHICLSLEDDKGSVLNKLMKKLINKRNTTSWVNLNQAHKIAIIKLIKLR